MFGQMNWPAWGKHRKWLVLLGLTLVAYVAAMNRAQGFFWLVPALLMATLLVGHVWPRWLVRRLEVTRQGPSRAQEGAVVEFEVQVRNPGFLPRFMVELIDHLPFTGLSSGSLPKGAPQWLGMLKHLPGRRTVTLQVQVPCEKRGFYKLGPAGLASSFPLGLSEARVLCDHSQQTLTVYPDVFSVLHLPLRGAPSQIHRGGYQLPEGAGAAEFSGLREYRRGDNPRHIHWPTTARLSELMVREFEPLASACMFLMLDQTQAANVGAGRHTTFEYAVRIAASLARTACEKGIRTRLAGSGSGAMGGAAAFGSVHYQQLLDAFAVVDSRADQTYGAWLAEQAPNGLRGETAVVFLSPTRSNWPDVLQALAVLSARGMHLWAVVFDVPSFSPAGDMVRNVYADPQQMNAELLALGAHVVNVCRGDDLVKVFNP
jgi:uncharacterized protein (DUF58 family)